MSPPADAARAELAELAAASARGDERAFAVLTERLTLPMRAVILRRAGGGDPDDLLQVSRIALWKALTGGQYDPAKSSIITYSYAITLRTCLQDARGRSRRTAAEGRMGEERRALGEAGLDPADVAGVGELLEAVRGALDGEAGGPDGRCDAGLDEGERWILRSSAQGRSDRDLASAMGVAVSTLNVRKKTALAKLRRWLSQRGFRGPGEAGEESERPAEGGKERVSTVREPTR